MIVVILGIILSNLKIMPFYHDSYGILMTYCTPMFIALMLLSVDLKELLKLSKKALLSMLIAVVSVSAVTLIAGTFMAGGIEEGWKIGGMFVGTYTGGSGNLSAIAIGLDASPATLAAANAADYVIGMPTLILMFALPKLLSASKKFQKFWPYSIPEELLEAGEEEDVFLGKKEWGIGDIAGMLCYAFLVTQVCTYIAALITTEYFSVARILLVTTVSLIVAQFPFARKIKGNMDLGMYISMLFLCVIGLSVDIHQFLNSALSITVFCAIVILGSMALHLILTRLFKIEYQYVIVSITAAIADGSSAALVSAIGNWRSLISVAVVLGALGTVLGNYLGSAVGYLLKAIVGA